MFCLVHTTSLKNSCSPDKPVLALQDNNNEDLHFLKGGLSILLNLTAKKNLVIYDCCSLDSMVAKKCQTICQSHDTNVSGATGVRMENSNMNRHKNANAKTQMQKLQYKCKSHNATQTQPQQKLKQFNFQLSLCEQLSQPVYTKVIFLNCFNVHWDNISAMYIFLQIGIRMLNVES